MHAFNIKHITNTRHLRTINTKKNNVVSVVNGIVCIWTFRQAWNPVIRFFSAKKKKQIR